MASRFKWVKRMVRELIQDGRHFHSRSNTRGLQGFSEFSRLPKYNHGKESSVSYSKGESRRPAPAGGAHKHFQNGSTLKGAVADLLDCVSQGFPIDSYDYVQVLQGCSKQKDLDSVKQVHDCIKKSKMEQHPHVASTLLKSYIGCGKLQIAHEIFIKLLKKDTVIWNIMIGGCAEHDQAESAIKLYKQMRNGGEKPSPRTYMSVLKACASPTALKWGKKIHAHIKRDGFQADMRLGTALVLMYANCGSIEDARAVFVGMKRRDVISWNVMIGGLAQNGLGDEAFSFFLQMQKERFLPDSLTYMRILNPSSSKGALGWVKEVHAQAKKTGFDVDVRVGTALVHMYAKIGTIADAKEVFEKMLKRDVVSWAAMIGALAQHGDGREALQLFGGMKSEDVKPNRTLFLAVLSACNHAGFVDESRMQFVSMKRDYGIEPAVEHYTCMVDTLGRAGHLDEAKFFILNMPIKPNKITWTALLGACRIHKNVELAELAAKECLKLESTDSSPYVLLSNVYAAVGNWDKVSLIRTKMQDRGIRKDPGRCWIEVDDKVHDFLVADTSHPETREIYAMLSSLSERLKDEGYIPDTRLVLWDIGKEDKESALCSHSERLAIAYGLIHANPGKPIRIFKNLRICKDCHTASKLISKITEREIVARDVNRFHHFKEGTCSCCDYW